MTPASIVFFQPLAFIDGLGGPELVMILIISLLLFGGKGMPNMARTLGKTIREFKKATSGIEEEIKRAMNDEPEPVPVRRPKYKPPAPLPAQDTLPGRSAAAADDDDYADDELPLENSAPVKPVEPIQSVEPAQPKPATDA